MTPWVATEARSDRRSSLIVRGFMSREELQRYRSPRGNRNVPDPEADEVVTFGAFHERGLAFPPHWFIRGLLDHYKLELHHLTPNGILQMSVFVTLCEAYLGIDSNFALWRYFFRVRRASNDDNSLFGGAVVQQRQGKDYFRVPLSSSNSGWHKDWFIIKNPSLGVPSFTGQSMAEQQSWSSGPASNEKKVVEMLLPCIQQLRDRGLTGLHILRTFLKHRVQPLQLRAHGMWEYSGHRDPTRISPEELPEAEVDKRVSAVIEGRAKYGDAAPPEPLDANIASP